MDIFAPNGTNTTHNCTDIKFPSRPVPHPLPKKEYRSMRSMKDGVPLMEIQIKLLVERGQGPRAIWSNQEANRESGLKLSSKLSFKKQGERVK